MKELLLHIDAVARDVSDAGTRHQTTLWPRVPRPDRFVVGVEQIPVRRIEHVVPTSGPEHELLEKPRCVRAVPFSRAGIRHRLRGLVFGGQWRGEPFGEVADTGELHGQVRND